MYMEEIASDGVRLRTFRTGRDQDVPTLLFINAIGMEAALLADVAADFARSGVNFVTWEFRGSPGAARDFRDCTLSAHVRDGAAVLTALGVRQVHIAGWCTGVPIALLMAQDLGDQVRSLMLMDGAYFFGGRFDTPWADSTLIMCRAIVADPSRGTRYLETIRNHVDDPLLGLEGRPDIAVQVTRPYRMDVNTFVRYAFAGDAFQAFTAEEICPKTTHPTLVTARRDDETVSYRQSRRAAELIPGARFVLAETGAHFGLFNDSNTVPNLVHFIRETESAVLTSDVSLRRHAAD